MSGEQRSRRAFLCRVRKEPCPIELGRLEEPLQRVDIVLGLAGEAHDERRAHRRLRGGGSNAADQIEVALPVSGAPHRPQEGPGGVLQAEVEVRNDHRVLRHLLDEGVAHLAGIQVEETQAAETIDIGNEAEEIDDAARCVDIPPECGEVLGNENDLADAGFAQGGDLFADVDRRPGPLRSPELRDHTERAVLSQPSATLT